MSDGFKPGGPVPSPVPLTLFCRLCAVGDSCAAHDPAPDPDVIVAGPPLEPTSDATETTYIEVPEPALRALLDLAIHSLDFGSGFWDQEDCDVARFVADLLGLCPNAATPTDMLRKYPACPGVRQVYPDSVLWWAHDDHDGEPA